MEKIFKIMLLGDTSTCKTSFLTQLIYSSPTKMPKPTQQLCFFTLRISNPNKIVQIWDSPGNQKYLYQVISILNQFQVALIFIDITNDHTFKIAKNAIDHLMIYKQLQIHIIQTKLEIVKKDAHKRKVNTKELEELAAQVGGCVFQYYQYQKLDQLIQKIVGFVAKPKSLKKMDLGPLPKKKEGQQAFCQCLTF